MRLSRLWQLIRMGMVDERLCKPVWKMCAGAQRGGYEYQEIDRGLIGILGRDFLIRLVQGASRHGEECKRLQKV